MNSELLGPGSPRICDVPVARGREILLGDLAKELVLPNREASQVGLELGRPVERQLFRPLLLPDLVHGRQEAVDVPSHADPPCLDVFVYRQFPLLPGLRPEPRLVGRHRNVGTQFNSSGTGYYLDLDSRLIEPVLTSDVGWQS